MSAATPKVSVLMAVYNGAPFLREAMDSILTQTFTDFEFVIVDDGSTDETPVILRSYTDPRIHVITQENRGAAAAANEGIQHSKGEYIARLDADDMSFPFRLEKQVDFLERNPDHVMVGGLLEFTTADGTPIYVQEVPLVDQQIRESLREGGCPFLHSSVIYRKESALQCNLYNEELRFKHDPDLYRKISALGKLSNLSLVVGRYRIAPGALSNQTWHELYRHKTSISRSCSGRLSEKNRRFILQATKRKRANKDHSIYCLRVARAYLEHTDDIQSARRYLWKSVGAWKFNWPAWYNLLRTCLPQSVRRLVDSVRQSL